MASGLLVLVASLIVSALTVVPVQASQGRFAAMAKGVAFAEFADQQLLKSVGSRCRAMDLVSRARRRTQIRIPMAANATQHGAYP